MSQVEHIRIGINVMENFLLFSFAGFGQPWVRNIKVMKNLIKLLIFLSDGPSGAAIVGLTFAQYVAAPFYEGCYAPPILLKLIAYATIMLLTIMNSMSVKVSNYLQIITMAGKVFGELEPNKDVFDQGLISVLSLISIFGIYNLAIGKTAGLQNAFDGSSPNVAAYAVAFYTCMWSYGGWERVCQCFDEIKNPKRNMPIIISGNISKFKHGESVINIKLRFFKFLKRFSGFRNISVSILLTGTLYILVNVAYFTEMTKLGFIKPIYNFSLNSASGIKSHKAYTSFGSYYGFV